MYYHCDYPYVSVYVFIYLVFISVVLPIIIDIYPHSDQKEWDIDINLDIINEYQ
jgi:hypothetical protein